MQYEYDQPRRVSPFIKWLALILFCVLCANLGLLLGIYISPSSDAQTAETITLSHKRHRVLVTTTRTIQRNGTTLTVPITTTRLINTTVAVPVTVNRVHTNTLVVNHNHTVTRTTTVPVTITVPTTVVSTVTETVTTGGSTP